MITEDDESKAQPETEVGYGSPPKHSRFKPGVSGNPKGRPKRKRSPASVLEEALARSVTIRIAGEPKRMNAFEAACLQLASKATAGDLKAIEMIIRLRPLLEKDATNTSDQDRLDRSDDAALIAAFLKRHGGNPGGEGAS